MRLNKKRASKYKRINEKEYKSCINNNVYLIACIEESRSRGWGYVTENILYKVKFYTGLYNNICYASFFMDNNKIALLTRTITNLFRFPNLFLCCSYCQTSFLIFKIILVILRLHFVKNFSLICMNVK